MQLQITAQLLTNYNSANIEAASSPVDATHIGAKTLLAAPDSSLICVAAKAPFRHWKPSVSCSPSASIEGSHSTFGLPPSCVLTSMFTSEMFVVVPLYRSKMTDCEPSIPWTTVRDGQSLSGPRHMRCTDSSSTDY